jgi:hypothetical protein
VSPSTLAMRTHVACSGDPPCRFQLPCVLIPPRAAATVGRERTAFHASSRHGSSILPPWPVSGAASVSPTLARVSAPVAQNLNHVTTPIGHGLSPEPTITVIDPRHPLCGRTLPLVGMTHHAKLGHCCVVWLRPHVERRVPISATNLAFDPNDISPSPLSLAAVEQLLRVFHDIQHASQGVSRDASSTRSSRAAARVRRPDCSPSAMEPLVSRPATARPKGSDRRRSTVAGPPATPTTH